MLLERLQQRKAFLEERLLGEIPDKMRARLEKRIDKINKKITKLSE